MQRFLDKASQFIRSEDQIVRDFMAFHLREFPFTPSEIVNYQLSSALDTDAYNKASILIDGNKQNVNDDSLPILLKLYESTPKLKWHLISSYVYQLPIPLILQHENQLKKYISKSFLNLCRQWNTDDEETLWKLFVDILHQLEEQQFHNGLLFEFAKKAQDVLIEKFDYNEQEVKLILQEELNNEWFSYNGILAVRAVGLLQMDKYIPTLASLLMRDDDILLEETEKALNRFQSDEVVRAVAPYAKKNESYHFALGVLKHTKSPLAEQVLVDCYDVLEADGKEMVLDGLTAQFSERAFPLIEDFIANNYWGGILEMEEMFYGFYKVMNRTHPLMEQWRQDVIEKNRRFAQDNLTISNTLKPSPVTSTKVGRNDPCPCGSGKKYKKCCGK